MQGIVFDIGGTWFRSAVFDGAQIVTRARVPAVSARRGDTTPADAEKALVCYLGNEAQRLASSHAGISEAVISLGAAIDGHTGVVLEAAPLWGPRSSPLDLLSMLRQAYPRFRWQMVNDVSAACLHYARDVRLQNSRRFFVLTVSTGIAGRTYDNRSQSIPLNAWGLQGEVGHLPIRFAVGNKAIRSICDCGGANHLNAFVSGAALTSTVRRLCAAYPARFGRSALAEIVEGSVAELQVEDLRRAIEVDDSFSLWLLDRITLPLAEQLCQVVTIDPEVGAVMLVGGVIRGVGPRFRESLIQNLEGQRLYQATGSSPRFWDETIFADLEDVDGDACLKGGARLLGDC